MKKYVAEFIGTAVLVILGCGTAMSLGCDAEFGGSYVLTAMAFGLAIVTMAYAIGNISGCHVNPAVSLAVLISGGMSVRDFAWYVVAQILGAFAGTGLLALVFKQGDLYDMTASYGSNSLTGVSGSVVAGLVVEIVLTFIFVTTVLGVTSKKAEHGSFGGLIIGLSLTAVHIFGIDKTGTSVNPARSIAPAVAAAINGDTTYLSCLWVFIVAPLVGAALAAVVYKWLEAEK